MTRAPHPRPRPLTVRELLDLVAAENIAPDTPQSPPVPPDPFKKQRPPGRARPRRGNKRAAQRAAGEL